MVMGVPDGRRLWIRRGIRRAGGAAEHTPCHPARASEWS